MALPKLEVPSYTAVLPSTGQTIKYRPFLVKEEKTLLLALESDDQKQIQDAVVTLLSNCITSRLNIKRLAMFDLEYLFLKIRAKSVSESLEMKVTCTDDNETQVDVEINLEEVEVNIPKEHTDIIELTDDVSVKMKYPSLDQFIKNNFGEAETSPEEVFEMTTLKGGRVRQRG